MVPAKQMENRYKTNVLGTEVCFEMEDEWEEGTKTRAASCKQGNVASANPLIPPLTVPLLCSNYNLTKTKKNILRGQRFLSECYQQVV